MEILAVVHPTFPFLSLPHSSLSDFSGSIQHARFQYKRKAWQPKEVLKVTTSGAKKILVMGGTQFVRVNLSRLHVKEGHQVTLFTQGKAPITQQLPDEPDEDYFEFSSTILHLKGDRRDYESVNAILLYKFFDVVYDINDREAEEVDPILEAFPGLEQYIYCSSACVYHKSDHLPHFESDVVDPKSRHKGKLETESLLELTRNNWNSLRPVYIYGPLKYNSFEEWFFHRMRARRPIPIPKSGMQIHV